MSIQHKLSGTVEQAYLGLEPGEIRTTPQAQVSVTFAGFEGDHHAGMTRKSDSRTPHYPRGVEIRNDRQVSIVSVEELEQGARNMGLRELRAEWIGANLLIRGIARLSKLPPATRLYFSGGATLVVSGENHPCMDAGRAVQRAVAAAAPQPDGIAALFPTALKGLRGVVASVEHPGNIQSGETLEAHIPVVQPYPPD